MTNDEIIKQLTLTYERAWVEGNPIATPGDRDKSVQIALRKWRTFDRRSKNKRATLNDRIEDVAKGLRDAFEPDRNLVGPLMNDYKHLAGELVKILKSTDSLEQD